MLYGYMEKNKPPLTPEEEKAKEERAKKGTPQRDYPDGNNPHPAAARFAGDSNPYAYLSRHSDGLGENKGMEGERVEIPE